MVLADIIAAVTDFVATYQTLIVSGVILAAGGGLVYRLTRVGR